MDACNDDLIVQHRDMADEESDHYQGARQIPFKLHRVRDRLAAHFRVIFDPFDLTDPQWRVLRALSGVPVIDTMALAKSAFLLGPSLSRILRDLIGRGLVDRQVDSTDARRFFYALTEEGRQLVNAVMPRFQPIYDMLEQEMGRENVDILCDLLEQLAQTLHASRCSSFSLIQAEGE